MKKFIIGFMCILLFSCHPITVTFASVTENEVITLGTQQELTLCKDIAEYAEDVPNLRQNGASYEYVVSLTPKPTTQAEKDIKLILDEITYTAWQLNIVESKYGKAYISEEFGKQVYLICIGDFK